MGGILSVSGYSTGALSTTDLLWTCELFADDDEGVRGVVEGAGSSLRYLGTSHDE